MTMIVYFKLDIIAPVFTYFDILSYSFSMKFVFKIRHGSFFVSSIRKSTLISWYEHYERPLSPVEVPHRSEMPIFSRLRL